MNKVCNNLKRCAKSFNWANRLSRTEEYFSDYYLSDYYLRQNLNKTQRTTGINIASLQIVEQAPAAAAISIKSYAHDVQPRLLFNIS